MMNSFRQGSRVWLTRVLSQSLMVGVISSAGLLVGLTPKLSEYLPNFLFSASAYAQAVSDTDVANYARSVLAIEPIRQSAYEDIKRQLAPNQAIPQIVCNQPDSLAQLPGNVRTIVVNFCQQSKDIVEGNGLTIARFNEITVTQQNDPNVQRRIQAALLRIQQEINR